MDGVNNVRQGWTRKYREKRGWKKEIRGKTSNEAVLRLNRGDKNVCLIDLCQLYHEYYSIGLAVTTQIHRDYVCKSYYTRGDIRGERKGG